MITDLANPAIARGGKITRLGHDFETYCDISVTEVGADAYSRHPSCEILMCGFTTDWKIDSDDQVEQWVPVEGEALPAKLEDALLDERVVKTCWNKQFEYAIWKNVWGIIVPHNQWRDTQALAFSLALPGSLEKAGEVVGLVDDAKKMAGGRALMRHFSSPRKPTKRRLETRNHWWEFPEKWEEYKHYNKRDVRAEHGILRKLLKFDMPPQEWELWVIDQIINERGIPFNMDAVDAGVRLYNHLFEDATHRLSTLTALDNPNSQPQLLGWLQDHGYPFDDLKAGHVKRTIGAINGEEDPGFTFHAHNAGPALKEVLELRQITSRNSPKKYMALHRCVDRVAGVLRDAFQFAGAGRTWRWAGRMFQAQNLPRPEPAFEKIMEMVVEHLEKLDPEAIELIYENPMGLLVSCIRSVAQAPDGYLFADADLNAIENRVLGWIANDKKILRVFELNRDPYIDFATYLYHMPYERLWREYKEDGDKTKRTLAKPGVLGCGYRLGPGEEKINRKTGEIEATGLLGYARNMGIRLTPDQSELSVKTFRETFEEVVQFWFDIEKACKKCVMTGKPTECGYIRFEIKAPFLLMVLPSGRALHYCRPRIEPTMTPWGEWRDQVTYEGLNDQNQWIRIATHGGKLTENADQAIARDLLAHGMRLAYFEGLDIRIHVHDQLVALVVAEEAAAKLALLQECMRTRPPWAQGLPLDSDGFVSKIFMKD